jgi:proteasome lid subunit RPN8/RPN11
MNNEGSQSIDVRILAQADLPQEVFPGGRNEAFRVFFTPEVHAALWAHAAADTSVEICGVLVGSWHRDEVGPFVKVVASIRGEGAETRFAEVTFTHQTWAKINAEMDTKFTALQIVGWYHTHPDFGIFLSDRDRFIQEHFFSGPGQIAHVIDPIRKLEGVFIWREGKPSLSEHFWIGDRLLTGTSRGSEASAEPVGDHRRRGPAAGGPASVKGLDPAAGADDLLPPPGRLMIYGCVFLVGYLLATWVAGWERQRFVESEVASNGVVSVLRVGLSDELDRLLGDLASLVRPLEAAQSKAQKADASFGEVRARLSQAAERIATIRARYGNTPAEEEVLRRIVLEKVAKTYPSPAPSTPQEPKAHAPSPSTK